MYNSFNNTNCNALHNTIEKYIMQLQKKKIEKIMCRVES